MLNAKLYFASFKFRQAEIEQMMIWSSLFFIRISGFFDNISLTRAYTLWTSFKSTLIAMQIYLIL